MKYPIKFTFLGFYLNSLIDNEIFIEINVIKDNINKRQVLKFLNENYGDIFDISLYTIDELKDLENYFYDLNSIVDEKRKFGISKNGICLLVAYCLEALQHNPENIK